MRFLKYKYLEFLKNDPGVLLVGPKSIKWLNLSRTEWYRSHFDIIVSMRCALKRFHIGNQCSFWMHAKKFHFYRVVGRFHAVVNSEFQYHSVHEKLTHYISFCWLKKSVWALSRRLGNIKTKKVCAPRRRLFSYPRPDPKTKHLSQETYKHWYSLHSIHTQQHIKIRHFLHY